MTIGILSTEFYLIDQWPGKPTQGNNPSSWQTVYATEAWPLGTKRLIYDDTNKGWATVMFLKFVNGSVPEPDLGAGKFPLCGQHTAGAASGDYFTVNNDASEVNLVGPMALALGEVLTATPYGWFWVGGVCPEDTIAELNDAAFVTDNGVTAQKYMVMADGSSYCVFHLATNTDAANFAAYSLVTDTTA